MDFEIEVPSWGEAVSESPIFVLKKRFGPSKDHSRKKQKVEVAAASNPLQQRERKTNTKGSAASVTAPQKQNEKQFPQQEQQQQQQQQQHPQSKKEKKKAKNLDADSSKHEVQPAKAPPARPHGQAAKRSHEPTVQAAKRPGPQQQQQQQGLSSLQRAMAERLAGGKFRWLNEQLYTTPSTHSFELFQQQPELFELYHEGFRRQVTKWPENPLDRCIAYVRSCPASLRVADFGCGDARLARSVPNPDRVDSFDLHAPNEFVTACDVAHVPLDDGCIDIGVFCLSLMGTNYVDFLREAYRVLKPKAVLLIAEVKSRFAGVADFAGVLRRLGFDLVSKDDKNTMFVFLTLAKSATRPCDASGAPALKPCIYKKR
eukprot:TRINITY_DN1317_c1_g1_i2.p1 TRINITY_DN1317_c1_g1~~TRINITY_DN1317_c1_g1_i2.p1  ORF type:complete len:392 (-),score=95.52 TRINITY_DN1317_c1_g1_i2:293-1408(-)